MLNPRVYRGRGWFPCISRKYEEAKRNKFGFLKLSPMYPYFVIIMFCYCGILECCTMYGALKSLCDMNIFGHV
jgi:hypothetical protein